MDEDLLHRRLPYSKMDIRVELYYTPSALHVADAVPQDAAPAVAGDPVAGLNVWSCKEYKKQGFVRPKP